MEKNCRQPECVNRLCKDGKKLVVAFLTVCQYYGRKYKRGRMVCMTCLKKSLNYYRHGEKLMKEEKCIMESKFKFPNFENHLAMDSSSEDESELQSSSSASNLEANKKSTDCIKMMVDFVLKKNKHIIDKQLELCDEYVGKKLKLAQQEMTEMIDNVLKTIDEIKDLQKTIYESYEENITNESLVDNYDINIPANKGDRRTMIATRKSKQKCVQETVENNTDKDVITVKHTSFNVPADLPNNGRMVYPPLLKGQQIPSNKGDRRTMITTRKCKQKCVQETVENNTDKDVITVKPTSFHVPDNLPNNGLMVYPPLFKGQFVYAKTVIDPECWQKCYIVRIVGNGYVVVSWGVDNESLLLHPKLLAYTTQNLVQYHVGCKVISKYTNTQDNASIKVDHFYAGVIAEPPSELNSFRYMIFFDDGRVQYRHHKDIRLIAHKPQDVWKEVNSTDSSYIEFLKRYLEKYPDRHMVRLINNHIVMARSGEQWMSAEVVEVDASLVRLKFLESQEMEWLYRGSARLQNIHDKLKGFCMRQSGSGYLNKSFIEFVTTEEEPIKRIKLESDLSVGLCSAKNIVSKPLIEYLEKPKNNKGALMEISKVVKLNLPIDVPNPRKYFTHDCNQSCVAWTQYDYRKTKHINALRIPLHFGFRRLVKTSENGENDVEKTSTTPPICKEQKYVCYKCPCGHIIMSMKEMQLYLMATKNKMTIEMFDFNSWVEPLNEFKVMQSLMVSYDLSNGKEFRPISCVNTVSKQLPPKMKYITSRQPMPGVNVNTDPNFLCGCDCTDDCLDKSKCACWQLTIKNQNIFPIDAEQYDSNIGYNYRRLYDRVFTGIYECNSTCSCSKSCLNRVVQQPLSHKLQLFMTEKKGWGVRCLNDIPSGSFVCIYVGYLLTENDANQGGLNYGDEYLAELDYIEVMESAKEGYEKTVQFSDDETSNTINSGDKETVSEISDDDYQASNKRSNIAQRRSKRKVQESRTKKNKDDSRQMVLSKYKTPIVSLKPPKSVRDYFGKEENVYIMDAKTSGNIGRYFNHSCNPNLFVQNVFVDTHDLRFPWISYFAMHFIPAGTELTWDYSYDIGSVPGKKMMCYCESTQCRKRLL